MCGRYVIVTKISKIQKVFNVKAFNPELFVANYNVSHGNIAPVITQDRPNELHFFQFGFTPHWGKKQYYQINARSEGDRNRDDDPQYKGRKAIFDKPMFRKSIRSKRCLVPVDCFIEGPKKEKLKKPYAVYLKDERPFTLAGIYDEWVNQDSGEVINSFAIITTVANELMDKIGHHRSPVIIAEEARADWLNSESSDAAISDLMNPYAAFKMNAYPIADQIRNPAADGPKLIEPIGQRIYTEYDLEVTKNVEVQGMGRAADKTRKQKEEEERKNSRGDDGQLTFFD
jgi:putative SOS response-associated peptidase YedK